MSSSGTDAAPLPLSHALAHHCGTAAVVRAAAAEVYLTVCTHALTTEAEEIMGLLLGDLRVSAAQRSARRVSSARDAAVVQRASAAHCTPRYTHTPHLVPARCCDAPE